MKKRNGFVSNSSSSSFVVEFDRIPKNTEEMIEILFDEDEDMFMSEYASADDDMFSVTSVASRVFEDFSNQKPATVSEVVEVLMSGWLPDAPDYDDFKRFDDFRRVDGRYYYNYDLEAYHFARWLHVMKKYPEWQDIAKKGRCFVFNYADENGSFESALEHGNLFKNLKHVQISNH